MTYVITEACIGTHDRSCLDVCPVDCILEVSTMNVIDPTECIDCGACEPVCPVDAIFPRATVPEGSKDFVAINARIQDGVEAVDSVLAART